MCFGWGGVCVCLFFVRIFVVVDVRLDEIIQANPTFAALRRVRLLRGPVQHQLDRLYRIVVDIDYVKQRINRTID